MSPTPAAVALVLRVLFLFGYALLFALVEIEIEGPHGWAERLPTWFRVTTPAARLYGLFMRGKPLTGYHAVMFVLPLWSFHIGFFAGVSWSWAAEAATLAAYLVWVGGLGFPLVRAEPALRLGPLPQGRGLVARPDLDRSLPDRLLGRARGLDCASRPARTSAATSTASSPATPCCSPGSPPSRWPAACAAPAYMRWYAHMRRPGADERALCLPPAGE